jgi:hypothetical protein
VLPEDAEPGLVLIRDSDGALVWQMLVDEWRDRLRQTRHSELQQVHALETRALQRVEMEQTSGGESSWDVL